MQRQKLSETMELLFQPYYGFFVRPHAFGSVIRLSRGNSANPSGTIGVLGHKIRALHKAWIECHHLACDRAWNFQAAALIFKAKKWLTRSHKFT